MPRITQQTLIALYGEVLTQLEIVEELRDHLYEQLALERSEKVVATILATADQSRTLAQRATSRAVDVMLDRFPKMELHPVTGDVLDPPQG